MFQRIHLSSTALSLTGFAVLTLAVALFAVSCGTTSGSTSKRPLKALLITGGCCHNYKLQSEALTNAVARFGAVEWKIINEGGSGTRAMLPFYDDPNWAKGFDVVVHNECFADTTDTNYI